MRLIDANYLNFEGQKYNKSQMKAILDFIESQPTAYDIDKVVEELELHSFEFGTDTLPAHYVRLNDAIEIVENRLKEQNK